MKYKSVRTAAKAVIIQEGRLLCVKKQQADKIYFLLPGGGQHHGETLIQTLQRECLEEIGAEVNVYQALHVREYIGKNHQWGNQSLHQVEVLFSCTLKFPHLPLFKTTMASDKYQVGIEWVELSKLAQLTFYPAALIPILGTVSSNQFSYLGDID
ncbi:MAG: NUDIX domain-containing protein [Saprospiraceae bacterium]|nr:NUDIX domain-containing protein [Saprospiraceae bacterium]